MEHWEVQMSNSIADDGFAFGKQLLGETLSEGVKKTEPGSATFLLFGPRVSGQSLVIKFGKKFEKFFEYFADKSPVNLALLPSGVHKETKTDRDLIAKDHARKVVYYREMKANINLDTEKLPATIEKIKRVAGNLKREHPGCEINAGCLCWSVYERTTLENIFKSKVREFEKAGVTLDCAGDFFKFMRIPMTEKKYYEYFRSLGDMVNE